MNKVCFFGAGRWGRDLAELYMTYGLHVDYFCDNNERLWGDRILGLEVLSPSELAEKRDIKIIVITKYAEEIKKQLTDIGLGNHIIRVYDRFWRAIYDIWDMVDIKYARSDEETDNVGQKVVFLLSNGLALGGVETWTVGECRKLKENGIETTILTEKGKNEDIDVTGCDVIYTPSMEKVEVYLYTINKLLEMSPCTIVCNFGGESSGIAFLTKKIAGNAVKVIAVIHNDEEGYYKTYLDGENEVDYCVSISRIISKKMIQRGFPPNKIKNLRWTIDYDENFSRTITTGEKSLRIAYAGRLTNTVKRLDQVLPFVRLLLKKKIDFTLTLAGQGDYENELKRIVEENQWSKSVVFAGMISHDQMGDFWKNQDVMVSFSEHEGHSISQCEAMSWGVVPVLTDVSGVRDDITDGVDGFIVPVGDVSLMAEYIYKLYHNRDILFSMSSNARKRIRDEYTNVPSIWTDLLSSMR